MTRLDGVLSRQDRLATAGFGPMSGNYSQDQQPRFRARGQNA